MTEDTPLRFFDPTASGPHGDLAAAPGMFIDEPTIANKEAMTRAATGAQSNLYLWSPTRGGPIPFTLG